MSKTLYRGIWYVYDYGRREFVRYFATRRVYYTPGLKQAKIYKNPHNAMRTARQLNEACGAMRHQAVSGVAAECLDEIRMRDIERPGRCPVDI